MKSNRRSGTRTGQAPKRGEREKGTVFGEESGKKRGIGRGTYERKRRW